MEKFRYIDYLVDPNGDLSIKQETFHTIVERISADCDSAIALLPVNQTDPQFARAEKGTGIGIEGHRYAGWPLPTLQWRLIAK